MTDRRRPLGTGPRTADTELPDAPRARLAAERLETPAAADPTPEPAQPAGRRALGTGPAGPAPVHPHA
ncbi:hypothetical protein ABT300_21165 [Streptomyces sp. NPDC001027]|uniref:hypothetical protein n=1 Tax=Streptomyces sp. NPDC001027 TaxID=3154771 RepID=UPI0033299FF2